MKYILIALMCVMLNSCFYMGYAAGTAVKVTGEGVHQAIRMAPGALIIAAT